MTLATLIDLSDFNTLVEGAFRAEAPSVYSSESELGEPLERFASPAEIVAKARHIYNAGIPRYAFGLWYPSTNGLVFERRVTLNPPRDGKDFRYSLAGWGIIHLNLYFTPPGTLQCRVVVNSEGRALTRQSRHPELGPAADWDWHKVEAYAFRLSRSLAAMGKTVPVVQPAS